MPVFKLDNPKKLIILVSFIFCIYFSNSYLPAGPAGFQESLPVGKAIKNEKQKKAAVLKIDQMTQKLNTAAKKIWDYAELALEEYRSSKLLAKILEQNGFKIEWGVGGLAVAFVAVYGSGRPVVGILGEYDALPGLSQKAGIPYQEAIKKGGPGHGCGHNIFGVAGVGAAIAIKEIMQQFDLKGTIKFFGCPAEETVEGKIYMAKDGAFKDLDICLDWHPSSKNRVSLKTSNALNNFEVTFSGKTSHAAGDPWHGRSALDAVELMNIGINYLREHVQPTVRMHYVIPDAGLAPNVVPDHARGWYYVRGKDRIEVEEVFKRVVKIAEGAALMTNTSHHIHIHTGVYNYLKNRIVAKVLHENLSWIGAPPFDEKDHMLARKMQENLGKKKEGMNIKIEPFKEPEGYRGGGSTDAADVSWLVPTASVNVACWPLNVPGHSWCVTSFSGSSTGFKGMCTAAKILACSAIDFFTSPEIIKKAWKEFNEKTKGFVYKSALPKDQKPRKGIYKKTE
jgi:aminobenzoyl-glutamate utilization protein B